MCDIPIDCKVDKAMSKVDKSQCAEQMEQCSASDCDKCNSQTGESSFQNHILENSIFLFILTVDIGNVCLFI